MFILVKSLRVSGYVVYQSLFCLFHRSLSPEFRVSHWFYLHKENEHCLILDGFTFTVFSRNIMESIIILFLNSFWFHLVVLLNKLSLNKPFIPLIYLLHYNLVINFFISSYKEVNFLLVTRKHSLSNLKDPFK